MQAFPAEVAVRNVVVVGSVRLSVRGVTCAEVVVRNVVVVGSVRLSVRGVTCAEVAVRNVVVVGSVRLSVRGVTWSVSVAFHCSYLNVKVSPSFGFSKSTPTAERLPFR